MRSGRAQGLPAAANDGHVGMPESDEEGSGRCLLEQDLIWSQLQEHAPWQFVLRVADIRKGGHGAWIHLYTGTVYTVHGSGSSSYLTPEGASVPRWTCAEYWADQVFEGDRHKAASELARCVREQAAGDADYELPEAFIQGVASAWQEAGIACVEADRPSAAAPSSANSGSAEPAGLGASVGSVTGCKPAHEVNTALLTLIRDVFEQTGQSRLFSGELIEALKQSQAAGTEHLTSQLLASTLARYGIAPYAFRRGAQNRRGYDRAAFVDAWARYLP